MKLNKIFQSVLSVLLIVAMSLIIVGGFGLGTIILREKESLRQQMRILAHQLDNYEKSNYKLTQQHSKEIERIVNDYYSLLGFTEEQIKEIIMTQGSLGKVVDLNTDKIIEIINKHNLLKHEAINNHNALVDFVIKQDEEISKLIEIKTQEPDYNLMIKTTVEIWNLDLDTSGSGVCINYKGKKYILSAYHLDGSENIVVNDGGRLVKLKLLLANKRNDLILFTTEEELNTVKYVDFVDVEINVGDKVYPVGNPMGITDAVTSGIIVKKGNDGIRYLISAPIWFGSSGGAVWNSKSQVIGICSQIYYSISFEIFQSYGVIINNSTVSKFLGQLEIEESIIYIETTQPKGKLIPFTIKGE